MDSVEDTAEAAGCPIRKSTDQSLLAAPRGLSQRAASFIASQCQGIHQMPFRRLISTTNAPRAGESPQGTITARTASGKDASHDPTDSSSVAGRMPCRVILGHKVLHMSKIPYPPRRISVFSLADILLPGHQRSLSVTVRSPWWRRTGSNRRPHACKARALPTELRPLIRRQKPEVRSQKRSHRAENL